MRNYVAQVVLIRPGSPGFAVKFRHPEKFVDGRPGKNVRKGLNTRSMHKAKKLVSQLNRILADESMHRISYEEAKARTSFDPLVLKIFYGDFTPPDYMV